MNTEKYLNKTWLHRTLRKSFPVFLAIIVIITFPKWFSVFHFHEYLNLKNGDIIKEYSVFHLTFYQSNTPSRLSEMMRLHSDVLPDKKILIRKRDGFWRSHPKNASCYTELQVLYMQKELDGSQVSQQELLEIISAYIHLQKQQNESEVHTPSCP
mgnify:CR=1 FL=1